MNKGCLIFAYNGEIDYGSQAVLAAKLVNKHLKVPVSVVTNADTLSSISEKFKNLPFDKVILTDPIDSKNKRILNNGQNSKSLITFANSNRNSAWELTPYDRTLVIDSDFLVLSNKLGQYWDVETSFLINSGMIDLTQIDNDPKNYYISSYSIRLLWATNIMFTKNSESKLIFDLVEHIKENYAYYAVLYYFDTTQFRNDYAFSIACHIIGEYGELPSSVFIRDVDDFVSIQQDYMTYLLKDYTKADNSLLAKTQHQDVHVMNKHSILNHLPELLALAE